MRLRVLILTYPEMILSSNRRIFIVYLSTRTCSTNAARCRVIILIMIKCPNSTRTSFLNQIIITVASDMNVGSLKK